MTRVWCACRCRARHQPGRRDQPARRRHRPGDQLGLEGRRAARRRPASARATGRRYPVIKFSEVPEIVRRAGRAAVGQPAARHRRGGRRPDRRGDRQRRRARARRPPPRPADDPRARHGGIAEELTFHPGRRASRIARQTRSGVAGISMCATPKSASASTMALIDGGQAPAWCRLRRPSARRAGSSAPALR